MKRARGGFRITKLRAWVFGLSVAAVAFAGMWLAAAYPDQPWATLVDATAPSIFAFGLVTVVFDVFFRAQFASELLELVGLEDTLHAAGIRNLTRGSEVDWSALRSGAEISIVLTKPLSWIDRDLDHVLAAAKDHKVVVEVFLPDPASEAFGGLAASLGMDSADLKSDVNQALELLKIRWDAAGGRKDLVRGSKLDVYVFPATTPLSAVRSDKRAWLVMPTGLPRDLGEGVIAVEGRQEQNATLWDWIWLQVNATRTVSDVPVHSARA
jgi:hypothetical protein